MCPGPCSFPWPLCRVLQIEVYRHIIETVVSRIEPTFRNMGLEAVVVDELKTNWEHRLAQTMKDNIGENNGQGEEDWADGDDAEQHPVQYLAPPPMAPAPVQQQQYLQQGGPARPQPIAAPQQRLAYPNQYQYQQQQQYDAMPNQIPKPVALPRPPMQQQRPKPGQYDGPSSAAPVSDPEPNKFTQEEIDRLLVEQFAPRLAKLNANRAKMAGTDGPKGSSEDEDEDDDGLDDGLDEVRLSRCPASIAPRDLIFLVLLSR